MCIINSTIYMIHIDTIRGHAPAADATYIYIYIYIYTHTYTHSIYTQTHTHTHVFMHYCMIYTIHMDTIRGHAPAADAKIGIIILVRLV